MEGIICVLYHGTHMAQYGPIFLSRCQQMAVELKALCMLLYCCEQMTRVVKYRKYADS